MSFICFNGKLVSEDVPVLLAANRSYRYGDGLFETMKMQKGELLLKQLHFERLFSGLTILKFELPVFFTAGKLDDEIKKLCQKNNCEALARIRLSVYRGNGGLYDGGMKPGYVIECWPLDKEENKLNENGLVIDIYPDARKSCDKFSNLKSSNFVPYAMAALYAKENELNDSLVLNVHERICDSTIANIFWIKDNLIFTPPLSEGCVAGVMRKYLLEKLPRLNYRIQKKILTVTDLLAADEVFLTNAIKGIRWMKQFRDKSYNADKTVEIYKSLFP
ncbi:MAG: aminotransferase class IV [Sphingobacteriales bacterium]|nr:aminotransferase class IV [Sphingobacteriales bacterium]